MLGATSAGEIRDGAVSTGRIVVAVSFFAHTRLSGALFERGAISDDERAMDSDADAALGRRLAARLVGPDTRAIVLLGTGRDVDIGQVLTTLHGCCPDIPVAGGTAADNMQLQQTLVFDHGRACECGVVAVALHGSDLRVHRYWHLSWQSIGKEMTVTKANRSRLFELDHQPAMQVYRRYLGDDIEHNFYKRVLAFPLLARRGDMWVARVPFARLPDGALHFGADLHVGDKVHFGFASVPLILATCGDLVRSVRADDVESVFVYSCAARQAFMQDAAEIETRPLAELAPTAGFFTYGEYFSCAGSHQHLHATMTVLALSERPAPQAAAKPAAQVPADAGTAKVASLQRYADSDTGSGQYTSSLLSLTHLINAVTDELKQSNQQLSATLRLVEEERSKSDRLLLNILPADVASELKEHGFSRPRLYERVTVLFTDIKGFTGIAEVLSPEEIIRELDRCFLRFDEICERFGLERIKTIGDAYMAAGGVPSRNDSNPFDVVAAALQMQAFMRDLNAEKLRAGAAPWAIRIGVHTGPVVAGVVGKKKFAYDIWGDAVNVAARMEQHGEAGRVNISGDTQRMVAGDARFRCLYRGRIHAKNKGEVDMFFVEPAADADADTGGTTTAPDRARNSD